MKCQYNCVTINNTLTDHYNVFKKSAGGTERSNEDGEKTSLTQDTVVENGRMVDGLNVQKVKQTSVERIRSV